MAFGKTGIRLTCMVPGLLLDGSALTHDQVELWESEGWYYQTMCQRHSQHPFGFVVSLKHPPKLIHQLQQPARLQKHISQHLLNLQLCLVIIEAFLNFTSFPLVSSFELQHCRKSRVWAVFDKHHSYFFTRILKVASLPLQTLFCHVNCFIQTNPVIHRILFHHS